MQVYILYTREPEQMAYHVTTSKEKSIEVAEKQETITLFDVWEDEDVKFTTSNFDEYKSYLLNNN